MSRRVSGKIRVADNLAPVIYVVCGVIIAAAETAEVGRRAALPEKSVNRIVAWSRPSDGRSTLVHCEGIAKSITG